MFYKATGNITIRQGPAATFPQVTEGEKYVLTNDILEVSETAGGFAHIVAIYRANVLQALAPAAWCGTLYLSLTTYTPPVADKITVTISDDIGIVFETDGKRYTGTAHMSGSAELVAG